MNNQKLDEIRQLILALLVSRKGATSVPLLERDYYNEEKTRIPYRQFGYSNIVEFLQSFPEHFIVEQYNGGHYVRGIPSERSRHVSSLVSRQRMREPPRARYILPRLRPPFNRRPHQTDAVTVVQRSVPFVSISAQQLRGQLQLLSHQLRLDGNIIFPILSNDSHNAAQQQQHTDPYILGLIKNIL
ncbi:Tudor domain-containing protein 5 [Temnothorax longispinosus]|uniref:Tudor domain-containing protein 5 n=1 Tax=Temnothorax longispinosus TaxID=300112 RepID=A0A4S2KHK4_9HYME|nr:Tudor domain-containing protein 5 [Temnothorax longispinosus]